MFQFERLNELVAPYLDNEERARLSRAFLFGADAHERQKRSSGEPYFTHPVAVACILAEMSMDVDTLIAALLHDVIEDTEVDAAQIGNAFGEEVSKLVTGVTKLDKIEFTSKAEAQAENFRKMLLAMVEDIRVIIIKLSDRLHNMTTLGPLKPAKRRRIALETLDIYAPIAHRLGMHHFKNEFEDLAFEAIYPLRYRVLKSRVAEARGHRKKLFEKLHQSLANHLSRENIPADMIQGREKRLYSIYRKMRSKGLSFAEIMDVYAFRIIARSYKECYWILGLVHALYKPIPKKFKDYIATPKANGYQSLHTTLFGPYGIPVEIQIRTEAMDYTADRGVAAHWVYKSDDITGEKAQRWLQRLNILQKQTSSSMELIENVKVDLFPDEVYVFTPTGDIVELPSGATVIDFAYHIHSQVGNSCIAARVNRRLVPLSHQLKHGDTVEIMTSPKGHPSPSWLNFVTTGKAKSAIKLYMRNQENETAHALGKRLLAQALNRYKINLETMSVLFQQVAADAFQISNFRNLLIQIGKGELNCSAVADKIGELADEDLPTIPEEERSQLTVTIDGAENMNTRFPSCCMAIPGDAIAGVLIQGKGLEVHRETCSTLQHYRKNARESDYLVHVTWSPSIRLDFPVRLRIDTSNYRGAVAVIATAINESGSDIRTFRIEEADANYGIIHTTVLVRNRRHLARVMRNLRRTRRVFKVNRLPAGSA